MFESKLYTKLHTYVATYMLDTLFIVLWMGRSKRKLVQATIFSIKYQVRCIH